MLRVSPIDERLVRPGVSKNSVGVMVVFKDKEGCNEFDLLMTDLPKIIDRGAEGVSSADASIPCFTEVSSNYILGGAYAGVAMTSSKVLDKESTVISIRGSPVLALSARYGGVVTQVNRSNKSWRQGDRMIIGPEYKPPRGRGLSTWYPVVRGTLFHSNIFNLLCAAFGQELDGWRDVLLEIGEKVPQIETKSTPYPDIADADGPSMLEFLNTQRAFWWTRLSYVTAKLIGTTWTTNAMKKWVTDFYDQEIVIEQEAGNLLREERNILLRCLAQCRIYEAGARAADPITKYTANSFNNGIDVGALETAKFNAVDDTVRGAITAAPVATLTGITVPVMVNIEKSFKAAVAGVYKKMMLSYLRGIARSDAVVNDQGLVEIV